VPALQQGNSIDWFCFENCFQLQTNKNSLFYLNWNSGIWCDGVCDTGDVPDLKLQVESARKLFLQAKEESKLSDESQLHLAEVPCEGRLIWPTVAAYSGVKSISQSKLDKYELAYLPGGLLVRVKILTESPSQIFSPATHFTDLISVARNET
jgi:hypothetical protein